MISIDFNKGTIEGFVISPASIMRKHTFHVLKKGIGSNVENML